MFYLTKVGFHKEVLFSESTFCSISESTGLWSSWHSLLQVKAWKTLVTFTSSLFRDGIKHGFVIIGDCHK